MNLNSISLTGCPTMGKLDPKTDKYNGCYGLLQENISDLVLGPGTTPFHHHNITHGINIAEWPVKLLSSYNCSQEKSREDSVVSDCMDTFQTAFDGSLWALIAFFFVMFALLMKIHFKIQNDLNPQRKRASEAIANNLWTVSTFVLQHDAMDDNQWIGKFISFLLCVFVFLITIYFGNMMSTDLVTIKDPKVIRSYDEITETEGMRPIFYTDVDDFKFFNDSNELSSAKKLWKKVEKIGLKNCRIESNGKNSMDEYLIAMKRFAAFNTTFVVLAPFEESFRIFFCIQKNKDICTFEVTDPEESFNKLYSMLIRQEFEASDLFRNHLKPFFTRIIETGIIDYIFGDRLSSITIGSLTPYNSHETGVAACLSDSIVTFPPSYDALRTENLKKLFVTFGCMILASCLVLMFEHYLWFKTEFKKMKMAQLRESFDPTKVRMSRSYHKTVAAMKRKALKNKRPKQARRLHKEVGVSTVDRIHSHNSQ